jgi:hypothetical protein
MGVVKGNGYGEIMVCAFAMKIGKHVKKQICRVPSEGNRGCRIQCDWFKGILVNASKERPNNKMVEWRTSECFRGRWQVE